MKKPREPIGIRMEHGPSAFHPLEQSLGNMDLKLSMALAYTQETDESHRRRYLEIKTRVQSWLPKRDFSNGFSANDFELLNSGKEEFGNEYPAFGALFHLCAAEHMLSLGHREKSWACIHLAQRALVDAAIKKVITENELKRQKIGGMKRAASDQERLAYAALLIRQLAKIRKSPWASREEVIDEIHPLMDAFLGAYRDTTKKPTLRKDLDDWMTKIPEVMAAFRETCTPEALTKEV